jgi:predicted nucleic acid-binding protein
MIRAVLDANVFVSALLSPMCQGIKILTAREFLGVLAHLRTL